MISSMIDFLHLLATVTWIGGMIYVNLALIPSLTAIDPPQRGRLLGAVAGRFAILAWGSVVVLLVTGLLKTPPGQLFRPSTTFGAILALKHALTLLMVFAGLLVTLVIAPKLGTLTPKPGEKPSLDFLKVQKQLSMLGLANMIMGVAVLPLVAIQ